MSTDDTPTPSPAPPHNDGEFLLRLVKNHPNNHRHPPPPQNNLSLDPAVAAIGPTIPIPSSSHPHHHRHHTHSDLSSVTPFSISPRNPNPNFLGFPQNWPRHHSPSPPHHSTTSFFTAPHQHFDRFRNQRPGLDSDKRFLQNYSNAPGLGFQFDVELNKERELGFDLGGGTRNGFESNRNTDHRVGWSHHGSSLAQGRGCGVGTGPPPGFSGGQRRSVSEFGGGSNVNVWGELSCSPNEFSNNRSSGGVGFSLSGNSKDHERNRRGSSSNSKDHERDRWGSSRDSNNGVGLGIGLSGQLDHPGFPTGSAFHSVLPPPEEKSLLNLRGHLVDNGVSHDDIDDLSEQLVDSLLGENESREKNGSTKKNHFRDKDFRSDARGKWILSQRMRNARRLIECRRDIDKLNAKFLEIYQSLIPKGEEKAKQKQLLTLLENLVCKEWPDARLFVYGSCANSFGVSKSDIDICLALDVQDIINKSEVLLKLADILQSGSLQNVQALTRARVPIVKLMDPGTGISCDICINNVLAVVNTKLLRDYADIDVRLRQLAFLVKHWAKSRGINETYQGTLSSYAYVLMCIHFLQQRNPPILPCLQGMEATYAVTVDDIRCTFFDQVEKLRDFGARNRESIAYLLWAFFNYWAYCHDYANSVISIRTGSILSKHEKDWTRRIGNDRHLICIEDPFETSHDLGRVVDKHSIRVLREEFERAAEIMQYDPNPCVALFEPYVP